MNDAPKTGVSSHYVEVLGSKLHYLEEGDGNPIVFLHGIPASSYLWRQILPQLSGLGRCIALDLVGFGKSDKPNIDYTIDDHIQYFSAFMEALNLKSVTLVIHGFGSIIGFDYAMRNENNCAGIVFYEGFVRPFKLEGISLPFQEQLSSLFDTDILKNPIQVIDKIIPQSILEQLSDDIIMRYREPFLTHGSGKPLQTYFRELGNPSNKIDSIIASYSAALQKSSLPKLMLYSSPGFQTTMSTLMWAKENLTRIELIEVGEGLDYVQEYNPILMGQSISAWLQAIQQQ